jgi:hypothetical protein
MGKWTREQIIEAAKQTAAGHPGPLSKVAFCRRSGIGEYHLYLLFPEGGWGEVCELAGIARHPCNLGRLTNEQLLQEFHRVVCEVGAIPSWMRFRSLARFGHTRIRKRFGSKRTTLQHYREWLAKNHPDSPLLQLFPSNLKEETEAKRGLGPQWAGEPQPAKGAATFYGAPLNFRGLRHAPTNEQGVVYLFGMVSSELGLFVEAIHQGYPDCEAKRCFDPRQNRWQPVRIEFEYKSSKFREHGHNPAACDLLVCWEHDWPECPLEIIELRSVIANLKV